MVGARWIVLTALVPILGAYARWFRGVRGLPVAARWQQHYPQFPAEVGGIAFAGDEVLIARFSTVSGVACAFVNWFHDGYRKTASPLSKWPVS